MRRVFRTVRHEQQAIAVNAVATLLRWEVIGRNDFDYFAESEHPGYLVTMDPVSCVDAVCPVTKQVFSSKGTRAFICFDKLRRVGTTSVWLIWLRLSTKLAGRKLHPTLRPVVANMGDGTFMLGWLETGR